MRGYKKLIIEMTETELVEALHETDYSMARLSEDILGLLVEKGVVRVEELPYQSMEKVSLRTRLRNRLSEIKAEQFKAGIR